MNYTYIQIQSKADVSAVLKEFDLQGVKWINSVKALESVPEYDFELTTIKRYIVFVERDEGFKYLQTESFYEGDVYPTNWRVLGTREFLNECEGVQTIPFGSLKKGQIFRFSGQKKVFEVERRTIKEIEYFPHDNVLGDFRQKKKSSALTVEIGFTY